MFFLPVCSTSIDFSSIGFSMAVCLTVSDNSIAAGVFSSMFSEVALTSSKHFLK